MKKTTIREEAEFISTFSTTKINTDIVFEEISDIIEYIQDEAFEQEIERIASEIYGDEEEYWDDDLEEYVQKESSEEKVKFIEQLLTKKDEFTQNIAKVYFDEYSPQANCQIFADIVCGIEPEEILERYGVSQNFYDMLQFRKYVKSLPKQYRKGLTKINDIIREIDETAIDGYRGSVTTNAIGEQLRNENRLNGKNIIQILNDQAVAKSISEKNENIEEQLSIAEEDGLGG